jgi:hypothetical protein
MMLSQCVKIEWTVNYIWEDGVWKWSANGNGNYASGNPEGHSDKRSAKNDARKTLSQLTANIREAEIAKRNNQPFSETLLF